MANKDLFLGPGPSTAPLDKEPFDKSFMNHLTCQFGKFYPVLLEEAVPSSSYSIKTNFGFDLMPMVYPLQSNINCHISFFRCAFRNLWKGYKDFCSRVGNHVFPYISQGYNWHPTGSLADYMGLPSYSVRINHQWINIPIFSSSDVPTRHLARGFVSDDANVFDSSAVVQIAGSVFAAYGSLHDFFSTSDNQNAYCYQLQNFFSHPMKDGFFRFHIVQSSSTISKSVSLYLGIVAYAGSDADGSIISLRNNMSDSSFYLFFDSFVDERLDPSDVIVSPSSIVDKSYGVESSSQVYIKQNTVYDFQMLGKASANYVQVVNYLIEHHYHVRPVLIWRNDADSNGLFGSNVIPRSGVVDLNQASMMQVQQLATYSNGHISYTSSNYQLLFSGIQNTFSYYSESALNSNVLETSPFVVDSDTGNPKLPISALPFRMYEFIYNLYFRNAEIDPFIKNGQPTYNEYLTNDGDGADSTTPLDFFNSLYEVDMFTSCKYSPMMGTAPLVGISQMPGADEQVFHFVDQNQNEYTMTVQTDSGDTILGISSYSPNTPGSTVNALGTLIQYGISINDFRSVAAFTRFLERYQKSGFDYRSVTKEFFRTNAPVGEEFPEYLGGFTRPVSIYKLENQTQGELPLGYFAGTGRINFQHGDFEAIRCFNSEQSYIMAILWFTVTPVYSQMLPKHFVKNHLLDFYNPQFQSIGAQPVYNYELAPLQAQSEEELMSVFGYNRPWVDYVSRQDEVHGQFRDTQHNFVLQREFLTIPQLGKDFITINPDDLTDVFSYTQGTDKIYGAVQFDMKCTQPIPRVSFPSIVG